METTGKLKDVSRDWKSNRLNITFETDNISPDELDRLSQMDRLSIKAVKYSGKRSLNANAYFHVLCGKLADVMRISKPRMKNILIGRYGQPDYLDGGKPIVLKTNIPVSQMLEQETLHCLPCGAKMENGIEVNFYRVYRGSHTYNTQEMGVLIDGTVSEAKDQGIETMPPGELERLKALWGN